MQDPAYHLEEYVLYPESRGEPWKDGQCKSSGVRKEDLGCWERV